MSYNTIGPIFELSPTLAYSIMSAICHSKSVCLQRGGTASPWPSGGVFSAIDLHQLIGPGP